MLIMILNKLTKITFAIARRLCSIQNKEEGKPLPAPGLASLAAPSTNNGMQTEARNRTGTAAAEQETNQTIEPLSKSDDPNQHRGSNKAKNLSSDDGP